MMSLLRKPLRAERKSTKAANPTSKTKQAQNDVFDSQSATLKTLKAKSTKRDSTLPKSIAT